MKRHRRTSSNIGLIVVAGLALGLGAYSYVNREGSKPTEVSQSAERPIVSLPNNESSPSLSLSENAIEQSDVFTVSVANAPKDASVSATWGDRRYDLFLVGDKFIAILGVDAKKAPGPYPVAVSVGKNTLTATVAVAKRAFPVTELALTPELKEAGYTPSTIRSGVIFENDRLNAALVYTPAPYFQKQFVNPLENIKVSGAYGNIRKSALPVGRQGSVELQHLGVDLEDPEGTAVYAVNDGLVRLVESFTNYGNTIVLDHGVGIFSFYLHLSEFNVAQSERVSRGEIIGRVGNTGYSLEPHLHFSVRIRNASVDPLRFIEKANAALR